MPLPLLIPIAVFGGSAISGIVSGVVGIVKRNGAKSTIDDANERLTACNEALRAAETRLNDRISQYVEVQQLVWSTTVERMAAFLIRNEQKIRRNDRVLLDGAELDEADPVDAQELALIDGIGWFASAGTAALTGAGTYFAVPALVGSLGAAGTGTAISGLSGAAATNAVLAWLGGGTVAAGGGGVAMGGAVLTGLAAGPAVLIAGLVLLGRGSAAQTKAGEHVAAADEHIAVADQVLATFGLIHGRIDELQGLLESLARRGVDALDVLESEPFELGLHAERLADAMQFILSIREVANAPIIDEDGSPSVEGRRVLLRHRNWSHDD